MKLAIGSDHAGFAYKEAIQDHAGRRRPYGSRFRDQFRRPGRLPRLHPSGCRSGRPRRIRTRHRARRLGQRRGDRRQPDLRHPLRRLLDRTGRASGIGRTTTRTCCRSDSGRSPRRRRSPSSASGWRRRSKADGTSLAFARSTKDANRTYRPRPHGRQHGAPPDARRPRGRRVGSQRRRGADARGGGRDRRRVARGSRRALAHAARGLAHGAGRRSDRADRRRARRAPASRATRSSTAATPLQGRRAPRGDARTARHPLSRCRHERRRLGRSSAATA